MNSAISPSEKFFGQHPISRYQKGKLLFSSSEIPPGVFYLKKGIVRMLTVSEAGKEITIHLFGPGSYFPLTWVLENIPNHHDYQAVTDIEVFVAPKDEVVQFLHTTPTETLQLVKRLARGIYGLTKRIESVALGTANHRIVSILLYFASHFGKKTKQGIQILHHFTHQDIAEFTGLSREHVSLELESLQKRGLIHYNARNLYIPELKKLSRTLTRSIKK